MVSSAPSSAAQQETGDIPGETAVPRENGVSAAEVQSELHKFMRAVLKPKEMLIVQPRRKVAHEIGLNGFLKER